MKFFGSPLNISLTTACPIEPPPPKIKNLDDLISFFNWSFFIEMSSLKIPVSLLLGMKCSLWSLIFLKIII